MYIQAAAYNKQTESLYCLHSASEDKLKDELYKLKIMLVLPSTGSYVHCWHSVKYSTCNIIVWQHELWKSAKDCNLSAHRGQCNKVFSSMYL